MTLPATDIFTGTTGCTISAYSSNWTVISGNASAFKIQTNGLTVGQTSTEVRATWIADTFNADQYAQCTIQAIGGSANAGRYIGVAVRGASDAATAYMFYGDGRTSEDYIGKLVSGSYTDIATGGTTQFSVGASVLLQVSGSTLTAKLNGTTLFGGSKTDTAITSGRAGVSGYTISADGLSILDNWVGGNLSSPTIYEETGAVTSAATITGKDATTFTDSGRATSSATARSVDQTIFTDRGMALSGATVTGSYTKTSPGIYSETGGAIGAVIARGADVTTFTESGRGSAGVNISGAGQNVVPTNTYTETGRAIGALIATGAHATIYTERGGATASLTISGDGVRTGPTSDINVYVGNGFVDVTPKQMVRTSGNYLYVSSWKFDTFPHGGQGSSPYNSQTLRMYKANRTGVPLSLARINQAGEPAGVVSWSMAIDSSDNIHVIYTTRSEWDSTYTDMGTDDAVKYVVYSTATDTWGTPVNIESSQVLPEQGQGDELVAIAIDASDVPHIVYLKWDGTRRRVTYRNKSGGTWSDATTVDDQSFATGYTCWHPGIAFDTAGRIVVTWIRGTDGITEYSETTARLFVRVYSGGSWGTTVDVVGAAVYRGIDTGTPVYIDSSNRYHLCFISTDKYVRYYFSDDEGATWTANNPEASYAGDNPAPAPGPGGTVRIYSHSSDATRTLGYWQGAGGSATWGGRTQYTTDGDYDCSTNVRWSQYHWNHSLTRDIAYWKAYYDYSPPPSTNELYIGTEIDGIVYAETGRAITGTTIRGTHATIYSKTGRAISALSAAGTDADIFTESGRVLSALSATGADTSTFAEAGRGIVGATVSGSSSRAATYIETGGAVASLSARGTDQVTLSESGTAQAALTATGAKVITYTRTGGAISAASVTGDSEFVGGAIRLSASDYITAGGEDTTALLTPPSGKTTADFTAGRIQDDENPADAVDLGADQYTELEWSIRATNAAAVGDVYEFRVTANGVPLTTYSVTPTWTIASPAVVYSETGGANSGLVASGADTVTFSESGAAQATLASSGADATTLNEAGRGIAGATISGASSKTSPGVYTATGGAIARATIAGADAVILTEAGRAIGSVTASGADSVALVETGYGLVGATASGASEFIPKSAVIYTETGAIVGELSGYGYDNTTFTDAGLSLLDGVPLGADTVTMTRSGYGLVGITAHGTGRAVNTAFALHVGTGRVRLLNSLYEVNKTRDLDIDLETTLKEVDDGRTL